MAIRMRLRRTGKKKQAYYRVVVAESTSPRDGRFIEVVGHYDPNRDPAHIEFNEERVLYWLKSGAHPTDTVRSLLSKKGLLARLAEEHPGHAVLDRPTRKKGRKGADVRAGAGAGTLEPAGAVPGTEEVAGEQTTPADEPASEEGTIPEKEAASGEEVTSAGEPPMDEGASVEEATPVEEAASEEEAIPAEEAASEEEAIPAEEAASEEEAIPAEEAASEEEATPVEEAASEEEASPAEEGASEEEGEKE